MTTRRSVTRRIRILSASTGGLAALSLSLVGAVALAGAPNDALPVKDIYPGMTSSGPTNLIDVNGKLYFVATDGNPGSELWTSDGTPGGTTMVKDVSAAGFGVGNVTKVGSTIYFSAHDGVNGFELWKSDGTAAGTSMVENINPGLANSNPQDFSNLNGTLMFRANDGVNGSELWRSDGTEAGTSIVSNINGLAGAGSTPGASPVAADSLVSGGVLYFNANDGTNGLELWRSDGSGPGTSIVKDINLGVGLGSSVTGLTELNGSIFFRANDGLIGDELWRSDGTPTGTAPVEDINPTGTQSSFPAGLTPAGGTLYFAADDGTNGQELWRSDGTVPGTSIVENINPAAGSQPGDLAAMSGILYFRAEDGTNGSELWRSDGTEPGTSLVEDIYPGSNDSSPGELTDFNGTLFFGADDGVNGTELWRSDGTSAGTALLEDINPGPTGSGGPGIATAVGGNLFFRALTVDTGSELWRAVDTIPPETTITSGPSDASATKQAKPAFGFDSDDSPSTFECRFDDEVFAPCSGPDATHNAAARLDEGSHRFEVRALDASGNVDPSPAARDFKVDTRLRGAKLKAKPKQPQGGSSIRVVVKAGADEAVTITAKGTAKKGKGGGKRIAAAGTKPVKLKAKKVKARRGKLARVVLKAKPGPSTSLLKALGKGDAAAKLKVTLKDDAGNKATLKKSVQLLP